MRAETFPKATPIHFLPCNWMGAPSDPCIIMAVAAAYGSHN